MLVRAAAQKQRRQRALQLATDFQQLYLPFLCPAQLRWSATRAAAPAVPQRPLQSTISHPKAERSHTRSLGSFAAPVPEAISVSSDFSQYAHYGEKVPIFWQPSRAAYSPPAPQPLILPQRTEEPDGLKKQRHGIGGSPSDLLQNLHTCLRVHRFTRAEQIIHRLETTAKPTPEQLLHAYRAYLDARLQLILSDPEKGSEWIPMNDWFAEHVLGKDIEHDEILFVIVIKAAMACLQGAERHEAVRQFAAQSGMSDSELLDSAEFDKYELGLLEAILSGKETDGIPTPQASAEEDITTPRPQVIDQSLPEVLEVLQKGSGLKSLKEGLSRFASESQIQAHSTQILDPEDARKLAEHRQRMVEEDAAAAAVSRWRSEDEHLKAVGIHGILQGKSMGALMWQWYSALLPALQTELELAREAINSTSQAGEESEQRRTFGVHLETVPLETVAATTIIYVMSLISKGKDRDTARYSSQMKLAALTASLGKQIQHESEAEAAKKRASGSRKTAASHLGRRRAKTALRADARYERSSKELQWPNLVLVKLGAMLVSKLVETARLPVTRQHPRTKQDVTQLQPAFIHKTTFVFGKKQGYLMPVPDLVEKVHREPLGSLIAKRLPMVVEPVPWTGFNQGGYLNYTNPLIRFPATDQTPRDYALAAIEKGDVDKVLDALNVLSKVPWRINPNVLRVQIEAWNTGHAVGNLAPLEPRMDMPPEPLAADANARRAWVADVKDILNEIAGHHSKRCHQNFQLEIARAFRDETIYFPHNLDFRGRAYPIPPYLNHMGADNARGLMLFGEGKILGESGLRWLKIHLANVFGYDKASLQEREDFAMQHLPEIYDATIKPLDGTRWWLKSDDPWQTLAACYELKAALDSPDPTQFVSHLPIHQDGTCNGLQHYAALGGDAVGARQVNLEPGDRPADVYTAVADQVKAEIEKEFHEGHPVAKVLHGKITRKVVKQPVMTNVYGVTYYGAKEQVKKQLETIFPDVKRSDAVNHTTMSVYIAKKIFKSLGEMFRGAQAIQGWLGTCADRISTSISAEQISHLQNDEPPEDKKAKKAKTPDGRAVKMMLDSRRLFKSSVIWTTPLRLPVVQPYRTSKQRQVSTSIQAITLQEPQSWDPVSRRKQLQGFPPNFIHSLDATHMMLSALKSHEKGMTFASIHDSFWTHAADIDALGVLLRDAFVHMHGEDVVGRLREEFLARYKSAWHLAGFDATTPVGRLIHAHQRATKTRSSAARPFKQPWHVRDLLLEVERRRLLDSEDPEDVAKGKEMVTSASIFEAAEAGDSALYVPREITDAKLGEIPADLAAASEGEDDAVAAAEMGEPVLDEPVELQDGEGAEHMEQEEQHDEDELGSDKMVPHVTRVQKRAAKRVHVWLPLAFPPVPEKGTFNVARLRQSRYFFH